MCHNTNYAKRCYHCSSSKMELLVSQYERIHLMATSVIAKLLLGPTESQRSLGFLFNFFFGQHLKNWCFAGVIYLFFYFL
jgi:hypothetical protein